MGLRRAVKHHFGIAAPRVAVRTHVPWYWRGVTVLAVGVVAAGVGWATYDAGIRLPGFAVVPPDTMEALRRTVTDQEREIAELRARAARAERQHAMESATHRDLVRQMKSLTEQNAALKEDIAFFQTLMPAGGTGRALVIDRFQVYKDALPGEYRYRFLLAQTGKREQDFRGRIQLVVTLGADGDTLTLPPEDAGDAKEYRLGFRFYQRVEGSFKVSPDAVVTSVQVRVFEDGGKSPKLVQTARAS